MSTSKLGTKHKFTVHGTSPAWVYTLVVKQGAFSEVVYRVAPERPNQPPKGQTWRVDYAAMGVWEAVTPEAFTSPKAAAAFVAAKADDAVRFAA